MLVLSWSTRAHTHTHTHTHTTPHHTHARTHTHNRNVYVVVKLYADGIRTGYNCFRNFLSPRRVLKGGDLSPCDTGHHTYTAVCGESLRVQRVNSLTVCSLVVRTRSNVQQFSVLPTQSIYVFCVDLTTKRLFPYTALTGWFL